MHAAGAARYMRRARTSALRKPSEHEGRVPSSVCVHRRDKGSTCAPDTDRTSVVWRMLGCTIGSSAAWEARDSRGSAQTTDTTPLVVVSANRCGGLCRRAAMRSPALDQAPAEGAVARISGWRRRRRNHSSEGRTGRCCEVHEAHLQAWRPRPAAAATATIVGPPHASHDLNTLRWFTELPPHQPVAGSSSSPSKVCTGQSIFGQ